MVSDQEIAKGVEMILTESHPNSLTDVVDQLGHQLGFDLSHKTLFIRDQINHYIFRSQSQPPLQQQHPAPPLLHPSSANPKKGASTGTKRRGGPGGLNKLCGITPELQVIVGHSALSRTDIVKQLWAYIKKNNLQDPGNKRKIICDDALRLVFETDCTDMFKMNKLLAKHIIRLDPTKESSQKRSKVNDPEAESQENVPSRVIISDTLANCLGVGEKEMSQSEALRLVWEYIKVNNLEVSPYVLSVTGQISIIRRENWTNDPYGLTILQVWSPNFKISTWSNHKDHLYNILQRECRFNLTSQMG